jgi:hypothetical protein
MLVAFDLLVQTLRRQWLDTTGEVLGLRRSKALPFHPRGIRSSFALLRQRTANGGPVDRTGFAGAQDCVRGRAGSPLRCSLTGGAMNKMMKLIVGSVLLVALGPVTSATPQNFPDPNRVTTLQDFQYRVREYAALHRRLEGPLPPLRPFGSPRSFLLNRTYLASAITTARPNARQGDIFTPAVSRLFREIIKNALAGQDPEAMLPNLFDTRLTVYAFHPRVYDHYPDWATHEMPVILLHQLPPLPEDVEYRWLDRDLVLWDIHADLIIDFLPDAISRSTT